MRPAAELDIENLVDFFEIKVSEDEGRIIHAFPLFPGSPPLDLQALVNLLARVRIYTFNGEHYDVPILTLALHGANNEQLIEANNLIIGRGLQSWQFYDLYGIRTPDYVDHVDLFEVAPGVKIGLKAYMGRMHCPTIQDMPHDFHVPVPPVRRAIISSYCDNDLHGTRELRRQLKDRSALRDAMSEKYKTNLRSKSDAQIAEAVIKAQLDFKPEARYVPHGFKFRYEPPGYLNFISQPLNELLHIARTADFEVTSKEEALLMFGDATGIRTGVQIPDALKGRDIRIGNATYRLGIGGLHSQESSVSYYSDDSYTLRDIDVRSYYPSLILQMGMFPAQIGPAFTNIYRKIYDTRQHDKAEAERIAHLRTYLDDADMAGQQLEKQTSSDGLKIVLNGTFGKLFSKYSKPLYAPELGIRVTMTGQLALLMLIEMMEASGIEVVSANTDGIVLRIPKGLETIASCNVGWWEKRTGLEMEASSYASVHFRDVNNYVAITTGGKAKRKGVFGQGGLLTGPAGKHPDKDICGDAVVAFLQHGTLPEVTIMQCTDIRKFLQLRNVKGGGSYVPRVAPVAAGGELFDVQPCYLGKVVRWYYAHRGGKIVYADSGNLVAGSTGCQPLMKLPDAFPVDVNHEHYVRIAYEMLADVGVPVDYWYHDASQTVSITLRGEHMNHTHHDCLLIDAKTYDKRK